MRQTTPISPVSGGTVRLADLLARLPGRLPTCPASPSFRSVSLAEPLARPPWPATSWLSKRSRDDSAAPAGPRIERQKTEDGTGRCGRDLKINIYAPLGLTDAHK